MTTDPSRSNGTKSKKTSSDQKSRPSKSIIKWGLFNYRFWREIYRWCYEYYLHNPAIVDIDRHFPESSEIFLHYPEIRKETLEIALSGRLPANHEIMEQQRALYEFDQKVWGMLPLRGYGYEYPENQRLIPSLKKFLDANPRVVSAAVSLFPPGKILRPHKGPFKGVWRFHLGLLIEEFDCGKTSCELKIDGKTYYLKEGDGLLWDDTFMHSASNPSQKPRVVLLFDVFRRDQPVPLIVMGWIFLWVAQIWQRMQNMRKRALLAKAPW